MKNYFLDKQLLTIERYLVSFKFENDFKRFSIGILNKKKTNKNFIFLLFLIWYWYSHMILIVNLAKYLDFYKYILNQSLLLFSTE